MCELEHLKTQDLQEQLPHTRVRGGASQAAKFSSAAICWDDRAQAAVTLHTRTDPWAKGHKAPLPPLHNTGFKVDIQSVYDVNNVNMLLCMDYKYVKL